MCYFRERTQKCTKLFFNHYLKSKLAEMCNKNELADQKFSKFAKLFDFIEEIKQADSEGKTKI